MEPIDVNELYVAEFPEHFCQASATTSRCTPTIPGTGKYRELVTFALDRCDAEHASFHDLATAVLGEAIIEARLA